jgi:tetratricopeptide (TPR) repeat protein
VYYRSLTEIELAKLSAVASQDPKKVKAEDIQKQFSATLSSAIKAGIAAKDADPMNYLNWVSLGRVYGAVSDPQLKIDGAYESAGLAYNEAFKRNPKNPGILLLFARLAVTHADLTSAKQYALQAIQMKQNYLDAYFLLTQIEVDNKNIKGAIEAATAASVINPSDASIMFQLGLLKYNAEDFAGAITAFEASLKIAPDYANAKYFLGLAYEQTGSHSKAITLFTDLKKTNPDNKEIDGILTNLSAGKTIFTKTKPAAEKASTLPVKENQ